MLEAKKYNLIEWIISLADESVVDALQSVRKKFDVASPSADEEKRLGASSYDEFSAKKFDLEELKEIQQYQSSTKEELFAIAEEARIEQPIDALIAELKSLG